MMGYILIILSSIRLSIHPSALLVENLIRLMGSIDARTCSFPVSAAVSVSNAPLDFALCDQYSRYNLLHAPRQLTTTHDESRVLWQNWFQLSAGRDFAIDCVDPWCETSWWLAWRGRCRWRVKVGLKCNFIRRLHCVWCLNRIFCK